MEEARDAVSVRATTDGDGQARARIWLDIARYYAGLDPDRFQVPESQGLAAWCGEMARASDDAQLSLVAERGDLVIGFLDAHIEPPRENASRQLMREAGMTRLIIDVLAVEQAHWRRGTGTQLMLEAEEWGRAQGAELCVLDTYEASPVSVPFYEGRMGYRRTQLGFRKRLGSSR